MILLNQPLDVHRAPTHLLPVDISNQPLLGVRIFLAHVPNIAAFKLFSSGNFREVFSQLLCLCRESLLPSALTSSPASRPSVPSTLSTVPAVDHVPR